MSFSFSSSLPIMIDTLNDVVYSNDNPSDDSVNELNALVFASYIINDGENLEFNSKMFFKHFYALSWKSDLVKLASTRVDYLIALSKSEQVKIKAFSYSRKSQYSEDIENHIGLYHKDMMNLHPDSIVINPIKDGYVRRGICHTNAFDIKEIEIPVPLDLATGKKITNN